MTTCWVTMGAKVTEDFDEDDVSPVGVSCGGGVLERRVGERATVIALFSSVRDLVGAGEPTLRCHRERERDERRALSG